MIKKSYEDIEKTAYKVFYFGWFEKVFRHVERWYNITGYKLNIELFDTDLLRNDLRFMQEQFNALQDEKNESRRFRHKLSIINRYLMFLDTEFKNFNIENLYNFNCEKLRKDIERYLMRLNKHIGFSYKENGSLSNIEGENIIHFFSYIKLDNVVVKTNNFFDLYLKVNEIQITFHRFYVIENAIDKKLLIYPFGNSYLNQEIYKGDLFDIFFYYHKIFSYIMYMKKRYKYNALSLLNIKENVNESYKLSFDEKLMLNMMNKHEMFNIGTNTKKIIEETCNNAYGIIKNNRIISYELKPICDVLLQK